VSLSYCELRDEDLGTLCESLIHLDHLVLDTTRGQIDLETNLRSSSLRHLRIAYVVISCQETEIALAHAPNLCEVELNNVNISETIRFSMRPLTRVSIRGNRLVKRIELLGVPMLHRANLYNNDLLSELLIEG